MRLLPSHTTVRTGPYTAVRLVKRTQALFARARRAVGFPLRRGRFGPFLRGRRSFTPTLLGEGQEHLDFRPLTAHEIRAVLAPPFNPLRGPFGPSRLSRSCRTPAVSLLSDECPARRTDAGTTPSADFCRTVRTPCDALSLEFETYGRSPEVSFSAFHAQPPDLRFTPLMDLDFAVSCQLVRRSRLVSGFCSSARVFAPCFFQTAPRDVALALR